MLNQAAGDRQILAKQLSYMTHSGEDGGLLVYSSGGADTSFTLLESRQGYQISSLEGKNTLSAG